MKIIPTEKNNKAPRTPSSDDTMSGDGPHIMICGAGIVGLVLALSLRQKVGIQHVELYEKVPAFHPDVGAGMGLYPNGLRVLRDLGLLGVLQQEGHAYLVRRYARHDGTEVAVGDEAVLSPEDAEIQSLGIRRWRLLKVLYDAVLEAGIPIHFGKKLERIQQLSDGKVQAYFEGDGVSRVTDILFGADGTNSKVRELIVKDTKLPTQLEYVGVTCLMGMANLGREERGICFPSSLTSKCHACYFPTGENEQCFQIHFPVDAHESNEESWGSLSEKVGREECAKVAEQLREDGWDESYLEPLSKVTHAVHIGFCALQPPLKTWVYGRGDRVVLIGDSCHVPVPYTGMGAQMGLEDVGVISMLLEHLCLDSKGKFHLDNFGRAIELYQTMRMPRTHEVNEISKDWGAAQQKRATCERFNRVKEERIRRDVFFNRALSDLFPGVSYDYRAEVHKALGRAVVEE